MARHKLQHLKQTGMPMHEYISKFTNLVEHAYGLSSHAHSSFILESTFIEGIAMASFLVCHCKFGTEMIIWHIWKYL